MRRIFLILCSGARGRRWTGVAIFGVIFCGRVVGQPGTMRSVKLSLEERYPIVPYPASLVGGKGEFVVTPATRLVVASPVFTAEAAVLNQYFENYFGRPLAVSEQAGGVGAAGRTEKGVTGEIVMKLDNGITAEEGYGLMVTPGQVVLSARTAAGMFMGVQTVRQLLPVGVERSMVRGGGEAGCAGAQGLDGGGGVAAAGSAGASGSGGESGQVGTSGGAEASGVDRVSGQARGRIVLPAVVIKDAPAYAWRGMHLDVSRHFFSIDYLRKFIDLMALYKFNTFHLHLTDDQGWRIEIKKYPKLTENGAWRTFNNQDSVCMQRAVDNPDLVIDPAHIIEKDGKKLYGGYYTQAEMRALVAYAAGKHITIIPEIDMPGHMMAAINQYPYLSCDGQSVFGKLFSTPICPCLPSTFQFAQDVYTEIMDIFPSKYLHIGGDEVDRSLWAKSAECQALMKQEGLKNTAELQSYFINKMEAFFNSKGRKLIGWDEILEGGISKTAMVMYWRSWVPRAPEEAAKNGNPVIMTPGSPLYFDALPDKNSLRAVYNFNIIPTGLTAAEAKNIIGAQANIWTEYIPSENRADYMYMPRMTALAEVLWSEQKDYGSYMRRLGAGYGRLNVLKVHYRLPDLLGFLSLNVFTQADTLVIKKPLDELVIRYTTDGTAPVTGSAVLDGPFVIRQTELVRVAAFRPDGSRGDVYDLQYQKQALAEPVMAGGVSEGLVCRQYKGQFKMTTRMPGGARENGPAPDTVMTVASVVVPQVLEAPAFGLKYRGYLDVPQDGVYSFYLTCDDGGTLTIAGREVVNNDGNHSAIEKNGQVALKKGLQEFALDFIEGGGGYLLKLKYSFNGSEPRDIPASWLKH
ncbi:MAG TPA: family 20 glycosylhydrolase [Puia sp.]|nr:family 20 glycosylhydrolase [Puia sp.]